MACYYSYNCLQYDTEQGEDKMVAAVRGYGIDIACWKCGLEFNVLVNIDDFIDWKSGGKYIQEAFPY